MEPADLEKEMAKWTGDMLMRAGSSCALRLRYWLRHGHTGGIEPFTPHVQDTVGGAESRRATPIKQTRSEPDSDSSIATNGQRLQK